MANPNPDRSGLRSFKDMPRSESSAIQSMGGQANSKQRKIERMFRDFAEQHCLAKANPATINILKQYYDIPDEGITNLEALMKLMDLKKLDKKTKLGDVIKLFEILAKYTGQEPAKEINLGGELSSKVKYITPDSMDDIKKHIADTIKDV